MLLFRFQLNFFVLHENRFSKIKNILIYFHINLDLFPLTFNRFLKILPSLVFAMWRALKMMFAVAN